MPFLSRLVRSIFIIAAIAALNFGIVHLAPGDVADVLAGEAGDRVFPFVTQLGLLLLWLSALLTIYTGCIDAELDDQKRILPGLGDAGDRLYGQLQASFVG